MVINNFFCIFSYWSWLISDNSSEYEYILNMEDSDVYGSMSDGDLDALDEDTKEVEEGSLSVI